MNEKRQVVVVVVASCCHLSSSSAYGAARKLEREKVYIEPCELRIEVKKEKGRSCSVLKFPFALLLSFSHKIKICLYTKKKSGAVATAVAAAAPTLFSQQTQLNTMCQDDDDGIASYFSNNFFFLDPF